MANTDETICTGLYEDVSTKLAQDAIPYAYLYGMALQLLRNVLRDNADPIATRMAHEFLRADDDHRAQLFQR